MDAQASLRRLSSVCRLADTGQYAALVRILGDQPPHLLEDSPTLALLYGIGNTRLGFIEIGMRWAKLALARAQARGDGALEARAWNVCGAICLWTGRVAEAAEHFDWALSEAERSGDSATVGRCFNNLGIIATLRGDYARAISSHTLAIAAFQRAGLRRGVAEALNNLAMAYKFQEDWVAALELADKAVTEAEAAGDLALTAVALAGRADAHRLAGYAAVAKGEVSRALELHRRQGDLHGETEDLRVQAGVFALEGQVEEAERMYRKVVRLAEHYVDPLLAAQAERDLAVLLFNRRRPTEASEAARRARARFRQLGADAEVQRLDAAVALARAEVTSWVPRSPVAVESPAGLPGDRAAKVRKRRPGMWRRRDNG